LPTSALFAYTTLFRSVHAIFLFMIISMRELIKDLENLRGDFTLNYHTIPVLYGEQTSKKMLTILGILTFIPALILVTHFSQDVGDRKSTRLNSSHVKI